MRGRVATVLVAFSALIFGFSVVAGAQGQAVTVTPTAPGVEVQSAPSEDFEPITALTDLARGSVVRTDATGFAQIEYPGGSFTRLDHETVVAISKFNADAQDTRVAALVVRGQTWNHIETPQDTTITLNVAGIPVTVEDATFTVTRDPTTRTIVFTMVSGKIDVTVGNKTVRVRTGQEVTAVQGKITSTARLTPVELCENPWICTNYQADLGAVTDADAPEEPVTVPFRISTSGPLNVSGGQVTSNASVFGTPFGGSTISSSGPLAPMATCPSEAPSQADAVLTTPQGDQVFSSSSFSICQESTTPPVFRFSGTFTVTGGTGRFVGASGNGTFSGGVTITNGTSGSINTTLNGSLVVPP